MVCSFIWEYWLAVKLKNPLSYQRVFIISSLYGVKAV